MVRHTEKVDSSRDPELAEAGKERARESTSRLFSTVPLLYGVNSSLLLNSYDTDK